MGYETVQYYNVTELAQKLVITLVLSGKVRVFGVGCDRRFGFGKRGVLVNLQRTYWCWRGFLLHYVDDTRYSIQLLLSPSLLS